MKGKRLIREVKQKIKIERKKKENEEDETLRQKRKLEFIINQTELYVDFALNKRKKIDQSIIAGAGGVVDPNKFAFEDKEKNFANENESLIGKLIEKEMIEKSETTNTEITSTDLSSIDQILHKQLNMLKATLKECQLKGLIKLAYQFVNQGIKGILADDMGLGKTIQLISLLAYLVESKKIDGPFLIVSPTSMIPNWASELSKFVPELNVLKHYGNKINVFKIIRISFQ